MSTEETKAVETKIEAAAPQSEVVESSPIESTEVDYEAELAKANERIAKLDQEKENYRKGMLKAKGKIPDEDDNSSNGEEDIDSKVARLVHEQLLKTKEEETRAQKDKLISEMAKKLKETTLALKNRGQVTSTSGQGSNQDRPEVKTDSILSNDQLNSLKAKGWDEKKIEEFKKNLLKANQAK